MKQSRGSITRKALEGSTINAESYYVDADNLRHNAGMGVHYQADQLIYGEYEKNEQKEDKNAETVEPPTGADMPQSFVC